MADFSFGFAESSFLLLNGQKHLRSVAEDLISNKFSSVQFIYFKYIHTQKYMFTIKKLILYTIANTFTKDFINGWGCKSQQNFDNRIIFIYVMEELPT